MSQPFKFRYLNQIVGVFVLGTVAILVVTVVLVGRGQHWFEKHFKIRAEISQDTEASIRAGLSVEVGNAEAGQVVDVRPSEDGKKLIIWMSIRESFHNAVRMDSKAVLEIPPATFLGDDVIKIKGGVSKMRMPEGARIKFEVSQGLAQFVKELKPTLDEAQELLHQAKIMMTSLNENEFSERGPALLEELTQLVREIREQKVVDQTTQLLAAHRKLVEDINERGQVAKILDRVPPALERIKEIEDSMLVTLKGLQEGKGTAGKLLKDEGLYTRVERLLKQIEQQVGKLNKTFDAVNAASEDLPKIVKHGANTLENLEAVTTELRHLSPELPAMVRSLDEVLFDAQVLIEAAERHWLLRKYVTPDEVDQILPSGVLDGPGPAYMRKMHKQIAPPPPAPGKTSPPPQGPDKGAPGAGKGGGPQS